MNLPKLGEIAHAWIRAQNPTDIQKEIAQERLSICDSCEYRAWSEFMNWWKCNACGCPLHKKIYSPLSGSDACPHAKWTR